MRDTKYLQALKDYKRLGKVNHSVDNCTSEVFNHFGTCVKFKGSRFPINQVVKNVHSSYGEIVHYTKMDTKKKKAPIANVTFDTVTKKVTISTKGKGLPITSVEIVDKTAKKPDVKRFKMSTFTTG